ncbi:MAG TPA: sigma-70 family RNA polymerase sigma factor [Thermoanaerobaculia bacterium]|nr:sigma-70 family RNA polymerase sigma factor [Thermoanaerobaculia bacterium]
METDDAIYVERARGGDAEGFRILVERYSPRLFRLAWRIVGDEAIAEDAVQETFLRAYRALPRYDARSQFGTWLHRIAANTSIEILRKRQRQRPEGQEQADVPSGEPGPDRRALSQEVDRAVREALTGLSPLERAAFVLRHYEERSIAEVCDTLGLRESAGKQAVFRAVKKLRRMLEPLKERRASRAGREVML